jgi:hypothetical protein
MYTVTTSKLKVVECKQTSAKANIWDDHHQTAKQYMAIRGEGWVGKAMFVGKHLAMIMLK